MPTRVWGCPTTAMWTFKLGPSRAKEMMFTGNMIDGRRATEWGLSIGVLRTRRQADHALQHGRPRIESAGRDQLLQFGFCQGWAGDGRSIGASLYFTRLDPWRSSSQRYRRQPGADDGRSARSTGPLGERRHAARCPDSDSQGNHAAIQAAGLTSDVPLSELSALYVR